MSTRVLKWLTVLAGALLVVSVLLFWFGNSPFTENNVKLELNGPNQTLGGDEVVYTLKYENGTKTKLSNLRFVFDYPEDAVAIKDGRISTDDSDAFVIESLSPGQDGEKEYRMYLIGERGDVKTSKIRVTYQAGNLRSLFEKSEDISTTITALPVSISVSSPVTASSGQLITYAIDYRNETEEALTDLRFKIDFPDGFSAQKFVPSPSVTNTWNVARLNPGQSGRIMIQGILRGREGEHKNIAISLSRKVNEEYVLYEKSESTTAIVNPLLNVSINVNGVRDYSAHNGDELIYSIQYRNNSIYSLSGLSLVASLEGEMVDFSTLNTRGGYYDSSSRTITWSSSEVENFGLLEPNGRGDVQFSVKLKGSLPPAGGSRNLIKVNAKLSTTNVPPTLDSDEISTEDSVITRVTSQPAVRQIVYVNDPSFGSSGPFPPKVGEETVFSIHWQIINPGNDLSNTRLSAILPAGVAWKNVFSVASDQPQPVFNKNNSEVSWSVGSVLQGAGNSGTKYELVFQVGVKPASNQSGSAVSVLKNAKMTATDAVTKQNIIISLPEITTNDTADRSGQGTVQ